MRRFGDPGYRQHAAVASMTAVLGWRLANADLLPFDYRDYGRFLAASLRPLARMPRRGLDFDALSGAVSRFNIAAANLERRASATLTAAGAGSRGAFALANRRLIRVERKLTQERGLPDQPWYRNLIVAPHPDDAYVVSVFPGLWAAMGGAHAGGADAASADLVTAIRDAAAELEAARRLLDGGSRRLSAD